MKRWPQRIAAKIAASSKYPRYQHGSALEKGGRIIAHAVNCAKAKLPKCNIFSTHAEAAAINKAGDQAAGATIYIARITKSKLANSKPCINCALLIKIAGIKEVVYSINNTTWAVMTP